MTKKDTEINPELLLQKQQPEEEIIEQIEKAELVHIVETLPVQVNNPSVELDVIGDIKSSIPVPIFLPRFFQYSDVK